MLAAMARPTLLGTARDLERLRQIVAVLARHGFGEVVQRTGLTSLLGQRPAPTEGKSGYTVAQRVRLVLQELGPSFVKLGQIASTRPDLLPADVITELNRLQDEVPPVPFQTLRAEVEEQLGAPLEQIFAELAEEPMASASIGQVHRGTLKHEDGLLDVAVKIQRPGIKSVIEKDVDLLYWLAHAIERSIPEARLYAPVRLVAEFDRAITAELDFAQEAANAERFAKDFEGFHTVKFPKVYRDASSSKVLTLEFLRGHKVLQAVAEGASGEVIARNALEIMIKMVFEHGFFHADPHPGNVLILGEPETPVLGLVDLGQVGRLSPRMRDKTIDLMAAAAREDYRAMVDAIYAIATPTQAVDRDAFEADVARLCDQYLRKKLRDLEISGLIRDLASVAREYGFEVPPDFLLVGKALMTVEGVGKQVHPELDVFEEVKPYFLELMWQRYSPARLTNDLVRVATQLTQAASDVPVHTQAILDDLRKGRLSLQVREPSLVRAADRLGKRIFSGMVVASLVGSGALLIANEHLLGGMVSLGLAASAVFFYGVLLAFFGRRDDR